MTVIELINLLSQFEDDTKVVYSSYGEMINMEISGVTKNIKGVVEIEGD